MRKRILFVLLSVNLLSFSQETPKVVLKDSSQLKLTSLKIDVKIIGNFATTTYDMKFYNELDRTLEGELAFPLGEGQSVSSFAMDVNGKLREAVVVEKELARVAYESTVRQNIDPGLLEKTQGNNYKARVYPILPNSHKHIVITHEQELFGSDNMQLYELPLGIKETLDYFTINIEVFGQFDTPSVKDSSYSDFFFEKRDNDYRAALVKTNHAPLTPVVVQIPKSLAKQEVMTYQDYFYSYLPLAPKSRLKAKPKKIALLWDSSYSLKNRNVEEELKLLDNYFAYLQNVQVQLISFSNAIHQNKVFTVNKGNWGSLKQLLKETKYDGGTALNLFEDLKMKVDETLLFTDGLANLGEFSSNNSSAVYTINSTVSANHELLKRIATNSGGSYVNLLRLSFTGALKILKQETFQFLRAKHGDAVQEVYPNNRTNVTDDFSITGKFSRETTMQLLFGYQGKVTDRITVPIKKSRGTKLVKRLWAKQKLGALKDNKEENKTAIVSLATQYHLITDYTSMIILDRIEDYVRYRIEPPQELREEYKQRIENIKEEEADMLDELNERKEFLFEEYVDILDWHTTKYPKKETKKTKPAQSESSDSRHTQTGPTVSDTIATVNRQNPPPTVNSATATIDTSRRVVLGTILDQNGVPLPGANVVIKGTTIGTQADFDGNFAINAEANDELVFSYIGFANKSLTIGNSNTINISLEEDLQMLEEVVITGMGVSSEKQALGYAVASIVSESLSGKVSGVGITGQSGASTRVNIRGNSAIASGSQPLYIVDGMVFSGNPIPELKPEDIEAIQVLNNENASKLYGSRAANGLIMITTKKGKETNQKAIDELNQQISEKIALKSWNPDTPYIRILEKEPTVEAAYEKYFGIRDEYSNSPSFYLDVADFFDKKGSPKTAITILTNLIEVDLDNHELMKALAYKLEYFKQYKLAVIVYKKVLELRPEEPQSYRDLALAYGQAGEYQKSYDLLYRIYNGELLQKDEDERYYGIEHIAYVELNNLVTKYGKNLKLRKSQNDGFNGIPVDVRVVIDWNHNDTDIDLWVIDPNGEKAYYGNSETEIGGHMSEDLTEGYGPEEFMLKNAAKGKYKVMIDYFADNVQKISGPTILKVNLFTNYGRKNEIKKTVIVRLDEEEGEIEVANLTFGIK